MALGALSRSQVTTWMPVTCDEAITDSAALPCRLKPEAIGKPLPLLTFRLSEDGSPLSFPFSDLLLDNATYAHGSVANVGHRQTCLTHLDCLSYVNFAPQCLPAKDRRFVAG